MEFKATRRRRRASVLGGIAATIAATGLLVASGAPAGAVTVDSPGAATQQDAPPSPTFLAQQAKLSRLVLRFEQQAPTGFVGLSIAPDGEIRVSLKRGSNRGPFVAALADENVGASAFIDTDYDLSELTARTDEVRDLASRTDYFVDGLDTVNGNIMVHGLATLSPNSELGRYRDAHPGLLSVRSGVTKTIEPLACQAPNCDPPLRGGVRINANSDCTAGFNAVSNSDGKPYLVTAGHCIQSLGPPGALWYARYATDFSAHYIGPAWTWTYGSAGDYGMIKSDTVNYPGWSAYAGVEQWLPNTARSVTVVGGSAPSTYDCFSGGRTGVGYGTLCGFVEAVAQNRFYDDGTYVTGLASWGRRTTGCPIAAPGDSGAPFYYFDGKGYGILSAEETDRDQYGNVLDCALLYQGLNGALNNMGVHLKT